MATLRTATETAHEVQDQAPVTLNCEELSTREVNDDLRGLRAGTTVTITNLSARHSLAAGLKLQPWRMCRSRSLLWDVMPNVVLARAVRWHTENRVLLNGHRTVVFR